MKAGIRFGLVTVAGCLASFAVANAIHAGLAGEKCFAAAGLALIFGVLGALSVIEE